MSRDDDRHAAGPHHDPLDDPVEAAGDPRLAAVLAAVRDRLTSRPDRVTTQRHLRAMRRARRRPAAWRRVSARALAAAVGVLLLTTGFAFAGALPPGAQRVAADTAERFGITLPRPPADESAGLGARSSQSGEWPPARGPEAAEPGLDRARERSGRDLPAGEGAAVAGSRSEDRRDRTPSEKVPDAIDPADPPPRVAGDSDAPDVPSPPGPPHETGPHDATPGGSGQGSGRGQGNHGGDQSNGGSGQGGTSGGGGAAGGGPDGARHEPDGGNSPSSRGGPAGRSGDTTPASHGSKGTGGAAGDNARGEAHHGGGGASDQYPPEASGHPPEAPGPGKDRDAPASDRSDG